MIEKQKVAEFYRAFVDKDSSYDGIFFAGIRTTGIFCRSTCSARKPKIENCDFFETAQESLLAGYRPCKRCHPLAYPDQASELIKTLIAAVEENPEKRWKDADFRAVAVDASTARRQFKKRFGMTFVAYARARRMGMALKDIREGGSVVGAQHAAGYESGSGFRDAFSRIMGAAPSAGDHCVFNAEWIDTPLGAMLAIADDKALYLLEFTDRKGLFREVERLRKRCKAAIIPGTTEIIESVEAELDDYFAGTLKRFYTPTAYVGTAFQTSVWEALTKIPLGTTCSYADLATSLDKPTAVRAVARANGANQLALVVPCHRVIGSNGNLTGYAGGLKRKQWLIAHEKKTAIDCP